MEYLYTVWFRDSSAQPDDPDLEWNACITIDAPTQKDATDWGDHLAKGFSARSLCEQFLFSESEPIENYTKKEVSSVPRISYGYEASDEEIGW